MPQVQLPIFPDGVTHISSEIAFERREGKVCYFNGHLPVFIHDCEDLATFRLFSSQLVINGNASQSEISRAFGVPLVTVKRYVKLYRAGGTRAFFAVPSRRRGSLRQATLRLHQPPAAPGSAFFRMRKRWRWKSVQSKPICKTT
jgi:transposase-like protein